MTFSAAQTRVDPVTFEVLRHRLTMIVDEAAQVLREVSGSPVASEVGDCNTALMDGQGNAVMVGPLLPSHALGCATAVKYILAHYHDNPGFGPGDMFISNDPYRASPHQACVVVVAPIFHDGALAAWTGAGIHLADVGGPIPGQVAVGAQSIFEEPTPMPPVKLVEAGLRRQDIEEDYLLRSRTREANALDLRAKIASNLALERRFREIVDRYGIGTVAAVLQRTIEFTATTIRERLKAVPDGRWAAHTFLDYDDRGHVELYRCRLELSKADGRLTLDFRGSSQQAPAVVNCSYAGLENAVVNTMLYLLAWDLPKCPAGVSQTYDILSEPGTLVHALWPAGMTKATTSAMQCVRDAVTLAVGRMFGSSARLASRVTPPWSGFSGVLEVGGLDQRGTAFATPLLDLSMASGGGARADRDGIHTCGALWSPGLSMANVEVYEQRYPLLYLARREQIDTAGAGRVEGGSAMCVMVTPHDTDRIEIIYHTHGMHAPSALGLHGGLPGSTNRFVVKRRTNVQELLSQSVLPTRLEDLEGDAELLPGISRSELAPGDVYSCINNGGGGYGDPLERSLDLILRDVELSYLSREQAAAVYGAAISDDLSLDAEATRTSQQSIRRLRLSRAQLPPLSTDDRVRRPSGGKPGDPVTDRLVLFEQEGSTSYACRCGAVIGKADRDYRDYLPCFDAPCTSAGPYCLNLIAEPRIALRHYICPGCGALVEVELAEVEPGRDA